MNAWAKIAEHAGRRFSVHVDTVIEAGEAEAESVPAGSRHRPARPAVGAAARRQALPFRGRKAGARAPPLAEHGEVRCARRRPAHPHPARHRPAGGRGLRLHRPPHQRPAAGRGDGIAAGSGHAPRAQSRPRCPPCARNSSAPAPSASPITSCTSTATASMTAALASAACASSYPQDAGKLEQRRHLTVLHQRTGAACCAITASRWSSSKPARPRRPSRRPSRSRPNC